MNEKDMTGSFHRFRDILEMSTFITFTVVTAAAHTRRDALSQLVDFNGLNVFFASALDQRTAGSFLQSSCASRGSHNQALTDTKPLRTYE